MDVSLVCGDIKRQTIWWCWEFCGIWRYHHLLLYDCDVDGRIVSVKIDCNNLKLMMFGVYYLVTTTAEIMLIQLLNY